MKEEENSTQKMLGKFWDGIMPPQCMPDQYRNKNYVTAYRNYYKGEKTFAKWEKGRSQPEWWQ